MPITHPTHHLPEQSTPNQPSPANGPVRSDVATSNNGALANKSKGVDPSSSSISRVAGANLKKSNIDMTSFGAPLKKSKLGSWGMMTFWGDWISVNQLNRNHIWVPCWCFLKTSFVEENCQKTAVDNSARNKKSRSTFQGRVGCTLTNVPLWVRYNNP